MSETGVLNIHTDGAARGNPGPAAYAFVITGDGQGTVEESGCIGETTNNVAEYSALVKALQRAKKIGGRRLVIHSDSELMVKQMRGQYRVKHAGLLPLYEEATELASGFDDVEYHHVRREQNKRADALCNQALDGPASQEPKPTAKTAKHPPATHNDGPRRNAALPAGAHAEILDCLRAVACVWSEGNPNHPRPEEVWDQLWSILEDSGVLKSTQRS